MRGMWKLVGAAALVLGATVPATSASAGLVGPRDGRIADEPVPFAASDVSTAEADTSFIVRFRPGADVKSAVHRVEAAGGEVSAVYDDVFRGATVRLDGEAAAMLAADPAVASIERDEVVAVEDPGPSIVAATLQAGAPWGLDRIDQRALPLSGTYEYASDGAGVDVYVIDSGVRADHVEFGGRVSGGAYLLDGEGPNDCNGHGTHVAGIVGASTYGVAKAVHIIPIRYLNCAGAGTASGLIGALDWMISDHAFGQPAVANLSLGGSTSAAVDAAVQAAIDDGITVVVAAGNSGASACSSSPARLPAAITVAATDATDFSPDWSNWGPCVDVFAPGVDIVSLSNQSSVGVTVMSGTSMASPAVAGAAALILQRLPAASPTQVANQITSVATPGVVANAGPGSPNLLLFSPPPGPPPVPSATFTAMSPARLLDTRPGSPTVDGQMAGIGMRGGGQVLELPVAGRAGVPGDAATVSLNVTVDQPQAPGFVTVFPCGQAMPTASSLNFEAGSTVANAVIAQVGAGGRVCLYTYAATHLIADVNGWFPTGSPFTAMSPARLLDTRPGSPTVDGQMAGIGMRGAGQVLELPVTGRIGLPSNVATVSLNVTVDQAQGPGFVTVFPCGQAMPTASSLNFRAGSTVANAVIAQVGAGGRVCLYTYAATHLVADVNGWFPTGSPFAATSPVRLLDTRPGSPTVDGQMAGIGLRGAGVVTELPIVGRVGVPGGVTTVSLNVTVDQAQGPGFVTVFPCGQAMPTASSLNFRAGSTVPNAVIARVGAGGRVCLYTYAATHLIADLNGWFTS